MGYKVRGRDRWMGYEGGEDYKREKAVKGERVTDDERNEVAEKYVRG